VKIRHKLLLVLVGMAALTSILVGLGSARVLGSAVRERSVHWIEAQTALLAEWVSTAPPGVDLHAFAESSGRRLGVRVTVITSEGWVIGDSAKRRDDLARMDNHIGRPEVQAAIEEGLGRSVRHSASVGITYLYTARKIPGGGEIAFVRIALPVEELERVQSSYVGLVVVSAFLAFVLLTAVAYLLVRRLSRPVERMSEIAGEVADGAYERFVPYEGSDEVGRLGASVERMRRALVGKIDEMKHEQDLLLSVMGGMKEALLLVGPDHRVRLANQAFHQVFGLEDDPAGRLLAEVVRNPTVMRDLEEALERGVEVRDLVLRAPDSGRSFELHVTPLNDRGGKGSAGALVLFFDITRLEALESVRREFVANVSHELRTPLTSIKAFVETLLTGGLEDGENGVKFLDIVRKHADRMEALIDDLTDLSLIETGAIEMDVAPLDASEVGREVVQQLRPKAEGREVSLQLALPAPLPLKADRRRLEQVLVNLVDNAVKFNRPGGWVRISGGEHDGRPFLRVEDSGIGIPSEDRENVFRRFYRVEKARSRELGGTGLGLSIVKHLMRLHGGSIRLESEVGKGSAFILEFPARANGAAAAGDGSSGTA
jgi:two-component system phosphate regulon sensor histidine kinase PhoR